MAWCSVDDQLFIIHCIDILGLCCVLGILKQNMSDAVGQRGTTTYNIVLMILFQGTEESFKY